MKYSTFRISLFAACTLVPLFIKAQPYTTFIRNYDIDNPPSLNYISDFIVKSDGFILAGMQDTFVTWVKTDLNGEVVDSRRITNGVEENIYNFGRTADGGFAIAGGGYECYGSGCGFGSDAWFAKLDASGDLDWTYGYGGDEPDERMYSFQQTPDGGYITSGGVVAWASKMDANGVQQWSRVWSGISTGMTASMQKTTDGNYVFTANSLTYTAGSRDECILKFSEAGDYLWCKCYGWPGLEQENCSVVPTHDGGLALAGTTRTFGGTIFSDIFLMKTDVNGNPLWCRVFERPGLFDMAFDVVETSDHGFLIGGNCFGDGLIKTDSIGNIQWAKSYDYGVIQAVAETPDGGFAAMTVKADKIHLIKTDPSGNTASCTATDLIFSYLDTLPTVTIVPESVSNLNGNISLTSTATVSPATVVSTTWCLEVSATQAATAETGLQVFPNPASGFATVHTDVAGPRIISLTDALGREVWRTRMERECTLDLSQLPKGMYLLRDHSSDAGTAQRLLVE